MTIKWHKSEDGFTSSKCGRYEIEPSFIGRTTPQSFTAYFRPAPDAKRERINSYCETQRDAKEAAAFHHFNRS